MMDTTLQRLNMVESQVRPDHMTDRRVIRALERIPREIFVPPELRPLAYMEGPLPLGGGAGRGRTLLAPRTFARLLDLAAIGEGDNVLDAGSATGYSAAVLAALARSVTALESNEELARTAREALASLSIGNVETVTGPLADGYPANAPYDVIVAEGSLYCVPEAWLAQLGGNGRLVGVLIENGIGRGTVWRRFGDTVSRTIVFDAQAAVLPGFEPKAGFVF